MKCSIFFVTVTDVNVRRRSPRSKKPFDAKHIDLPDLFDDEAIKGRNQRVAEVRRF